jgi:flagellar hook-associated protein 3 FlgL
MRISTGQLYDSSLQSVLSNQGDLFTAQNQLSSGKRILRPSDDPVGAAAVIRLTEELAQLTQYNRNNDLLTNNLSQEEVVLTNITDSVNRARVLTVQAGNGILTDEDRKAISVEIEQIRDEIFDLLNAQNANGDYLFAGYQSESPAFSFNSSAIGNQYTFEGDDGINNIQISNTVALQTNTSGKEVFADVFARFNTSITGFAGVTSSSVTVGQQSAYDQFLENNYDAITPANNQYQITILGTNQVEIQNVGTGTIVDTVDFTSGETFSFEGLEFSISGAVGDTVNFQLDTPEKKNLAETLNDFSLVLNNDQLSSADYQEALSDALVGLDNGLVSVQNATSSIGARLNVSSSILASNLDLEIVNRESRANIEDVDIAEAISEISRQETALEAAQSTFSLVTGLSLFDVI